MPRIKGETAEKKVSKTGKEYFQSRLNASKDYNKDNYAQLILRVPKDSKDKITDYVQRKA